MSGSLNRVVLIANLGADPKIHTAQSGQHIVSFSVATTETWKDAQSREKRERTEWHRVLIFNENLSRIAETYLTKEVPRSSSRASSQPASSRISRVTTATAPRSCSPPTTAR